jgi:hypothetical protein
MQAAALIKRIEFAQILGLNLLGQEVDHLLGFFVSFRKQPVALGSAGLVFGLLLLGKIVPNESR